MLLGATHSMSVSRLQGCGDAWTCCSELTPWLGSAHLQRDVRGNVCQHKHCEQRPPPGREPCHGALCHALRCAAGAGVTWQRSERCARRRPRAAQSGRRHASSCTVEADQMKVRYSRAEAARGAEGHCAQCTVKRRSCAHGHNVTEQDAAGRHRHVLSWWFDQCVRSVLGEQSARTRELAPELSRAQVSPQAARTAARIDAPHASDSVNPAVQIVCTLTSCTMSPGSDLAMSTR